ncbi:holo-ACP synthase [Methylophaga sp. OBS3]|uniref:holo-ACP synthase n=1 Tax=Methylophaga sp. OBS3 TaxID=2991934 RepID=UPI002255010F|nr:holo-ACP synthase [Methylophaga sp. OBS3]MCX4190021.1 holo-ACP synthase [Methylophaga sp. OBS3]
MILGIGTDLVFLPRIQTMLDKFGDKAAQKILSDDEFANFQQAAKPTAFLAKRFAAKEATAKAFGCGFRDGLSLRHISVLNDDLGKPRLVFSDRAVELANQREISASHLSLSDDGDYATAYVILTDE